MISATSAILLILSATTIANARPASQSLNTIGKREVSNVSTWDEGYIIDFPIHESCNSTERRQLSRAFNETVLLAQHAKEHILRFGNESEYYVKYFGNASTAEPIGWLEKIIAGDKNGLLFRCDDIDKKCNTSGTAGHWRGTVAPDETVICPLSFESRWSLDALCGRGWTVANSKDTSYFAGDLLHRLYHTVKIGEGIVEHYADGYDKSLELAKTNPEEAVRNSATLRLFAIEVYAFDIAVPGEGCLGTPSASQSSAPAATSTAVAASMEAPPPSTTAADTPSTTSSAAQHCHTHEDGEVHCT